MDDALLRFTNSLPLVYVKRRSGPIILNFMIERKVWAKEVRCS